MRREDPNAVGRSPKDRAILVRPLDELEAPFVPDLGTRRRLDCEECRQRSSWLELQTAQFGDNTLFSDEHLLVGDAVEGRYQPDVESLNCSRISRSGLIPVIWV